MNRAVLAPPLRLGAAAALAIVRYQPGRLGGDAPARVFLVLAAAALGYAAVRRRTPATRRVARVGTVALGIAAALAAGAGVAATVLCCLFALVLTVPLVWHRPVLAHSPTPG